LKRIFYLSTGTSLVFLVIDSHVQGFSFHDLLFDLQATALAYADLVYSESLATTIYIKIAIVCTFLGAILGGLVFPYVTKKSERTFIAVMSFLPSIFVAITQTGKGLLLLSVVFFYSGILVHRLSVGKSRLFDKNSLKLALPAGAILILILASAVVFRNLSNSNDEELLARLSSYFASYSCGHVYAFSDWFAFITGSHSQFSYVHENSTHGFYTFMSLFQLMGSHKVVPLGIYDENYAYGDLLLSNVYTMFRGLILDFGFVGSLLFMFLVGVVLHKAFHVMLFTRRPVFTVAIFVFVIECFYYSFIASPLSWNRTLATFGALWIALAVNKRLTRSNGGRLAGLTTTSAAMTSGQPN
jgi:oligosaccharide repeat unit polymerase